VFLVNTKFVQELIRGTHSSKEKYARLKAAYDVLSDSTSRQEYDQQLGHITESSPSSLQSYIRLITINIRSTIFFNCVVFNLSCMIGTYL